MALQGDWKVQALSKTFNLTVGEEIRETAYDLDGNPITATDEVTGETIETTTNKIKPFIFESKISSGRFRGADWTYLVGDNNQPEAYAQWSTVGVSYPLLKTPLRMSAILTAFGDDEYDPLPKGLKIVQGEDLESANDIPYITGTPTESGTFEVEFKIWAPNDTVFGIGNEPLEAFSADGTGKEYLITEFHNNLYELDLEKFHDPRVGDTIQQIQSDGTIRTIIVQQMYVAYIPVAKFKFTILDVIVPAEPPISTKYEWESVTLGQNPEIQKIVSAAAKASELLNINVGLAKSGLELAQKFLLGVLNPKIIILNRIADEIDNFVSDFRNTGFFILEVTPTGKEIIPKDADGNPIKLLLYAPAIAANYAAAAAVGQTAEFLQWTVDTLGIPEYGVSGAPNQSYAVETRKALPLSERTENANDDTLATKDPLFGIYKFTPSQVIAQTIAAMDDKLDERRPIFSPSAEVGAIMVIVAYKDLSLNIANIRTAIGALISFFGGETGLFTVGFKKAFNIIGSIDDVFNGITDTDVTLTVEQISGVLGTNDDKVATNVRNYVDAFEVNDFVVGPRAKFGARCMGFVKEIKSTETPNSNEVYQKQELVITAASRIDKIAFEKLGAGATLQLAHYEKAEKKYVDENTGKPVSGGFYNSYRLLEELSTNIPDPSSTPFLYSIISEAKAATTKVSREVKDDKFTPFFAQVGGTEDVTEIYFGKILKKVVVGKIETPKLSNPPPPNFKAAKLEDLIGDFNGFYSAIATLTTALRTIAGDSSSELKKFVDYLDTKIKELDDLNKKLQTILKLFTDGLPSSGGYVLTIPPAIGGNDLIKSALQGASNRPPDDLDFAVGFFMMGGGPSMKVLNKLLNST